jgi:hypothetical protein
MSNCKRIAVLLIAALLPVVALASTEDQLQVAESSGNVAFVLVTGPGAIGVDEARKTIEGAISQFPGSVMIESNRMDASDSTFVQKYGLASAPVPLVLVFASNGVIAGGNVASKLTVQQLVAMVPSPKKTEALKAIQSGQAVYVTAARPGMSKKADVSKSCAMACAQMMGKGITIDVNMDDPAETVFLSQLGVNMQSAEPVTVVVNAKGQVTATYTGVVEAGNLTASATKVASSGCCPSGSGKSCPPPAKKGGN